MAGTLYLVGTPIGNLGDFSARGIETLKAVDFIAAEDTRVTLKLLSRFEIKKPLISYHEHNRAEMGERIIDRLLSGESCALVSDAGMPAISDPGEVLVRQCAAQGVTVCPIPGACAAVSALAVSGLSTGRFTFEGFISTAKKSRMEHLEGLRGEKRTMIIYEAPHKLQRTLQDLLSALGEREVSVCREMTKIHEEILRTTLSGAIAHFEKMPPRGEFVLVLQGAPEKAREDISPERAMELVAFYRDEGKSLKQSCRLASADTGFSVNELYALATQGLA